MSNTESLNLLERVAGKLAAVAHADGTDKEALALQEEVRQVLAAPPDTLRQAICGLFHIGMEARSDSVILTNIENALRRSQCLSALERELFTPVVPREGGEDEDEGAPMDECPMSWGADPAEYMQQFRAAFAPSAAARDVLAERARQIGAEGYTPEHDDEHGNGEIGLAAALYALPYEAKMLQDHEIAAMHMRLEACAGWKLKPETDRRKRLVKAAALLLAEIERMDRAAAGRDRRMSAPVTLQAAAQAACDAWDAMYGFPPTSAMLDAMRRLRAALAGTAGATGAAPEPRDCSTCAHTGVDILLEPCAGCDPNNAETSRWAEGGATGAGQ